MRGRRRIRIMGDEILYRGPAVLIDGIPGASGFALGLLTLSLCRRGLPLGIEFFRLAIEDVELDSVPRRRPQSN